MVRKGIVELRDANLKLVLECEKLSFFGENGVLLNTKRSLSAYAKQNCILYEINREILKLALGESYIKKIAFSILKDALLSQETFKSAVMESQIDLMFNSVSIFKYENNEIVYPKNIVSDEVLFVMQGCIIDSNSKKILASRNEVFGLLLLASPKPTNDLIAGPFCHGISSKLLMLAVNDVHRNKKMNRLRRIDFFKYLSDTKLAILSQNMVKESFKPNEIIVHQNDDSNKFYYIQRGAVNVIRDGKFIRTLTSGSSFGEIGLIKDEKRSATITALGDEMEESTILFSISKPDFLGAMNDTLLKFMVNKINLLNSDIQLFELYYIDKLGKGKFGDVYLVHNTMCLYALKTVSRLKVEKHKYLSKYYLAEKRISMILDYPFIVKCVKTFKDDELCYFLIEFVNGLNLNSYLNLINSPLSLYDSKFYVAILLLILDYLNKKKIIHRDIKPDNIIIDKNGYLKLIDFGTAKEIVDYTNTVLGTPHYMAPEVIQGKGYGISPDYWSVGVCAFQFFYGFLPFGNKCMDIIEIYNEILYE